jgi:hypothetical protein
VKWSENWRTEWSGGDEKIAKQLERLSDPTALVKSYAEASNKIRSGDLAKPLPKDATPEQAAEWRKGNGYPETPDGFLEFGDGLVIGEDDKPLWGDVAKLAYEATSVPELMKLLPKWYYGMQNDQIQTQTAADGQSKTELETKLRETWGTDFTANSNVYANFLAGAPKEVNEALTQARDAEGNFILYRPEVVSWLVAQAREINPAGHIVPNSGDSGVQSIEGEIATIEKFMRTNRTEYNKDERMQARARQLYEARAKLQKRGAA